MHRRAFWSTLTTSAIVGSAVSPLAAAAAAAEQRKPSAPNFILTRDGTNLFYREAGVGPPLVFLAPWSLNSSWFEYQIVDLSARGLRCIAYDRRGHGRSGEPARGYDFDTLADDLQAVIEQLDLRDVTLVGNSLGCGEVVRYLSRHPARIARAVLISTITPLIVKTSDNAEGPEESELEKGRVNLARDRAHQVAKAAPAFFGVPPNAVSTDIIEWWTRMIIDQCSLRVMLELHRAFTRTDFRPDLRKIAVPVLLIHGDRDTSTILDRTSRRTAPLIRNCELKVYENAAHGLPFTHRDQLNADLLAFALR